MSYQYCYCNPHLTTSEKMPINSSFHVNMSQTEWNNMKIHLIYRPQMWPSLGLECESHKTCQKHVWVIFHPKIKRYFAYIFDVIFMASKQISPAVNAINCPWYKQADPCVALFQLFNSDFEKYILLQYF